MSKVSATALIVSAFALATPTFAMAGSAASQQTLDSYSFGDSTINANYAAFEPDSPDYDQIAEGDGVVEQVAAVPHNSAPSASVLESYGFGDDAMHVNYSAFEPDSCTSDLPD